MAKGENASTTFSGSPETFQRDSIGTFTYSSFPAGWSDTAQVSPDSTAPQPSAVVIETTDAFGHATKALATLPNVALSPSFLLPSIAKALKRFATGAGSAPTRSHVIHVLVLVR